MTADGWWPPWTSAGGEKSAHHPADERIPRGFSFHLRDIELLVTAFPGCRTRFFLPITTCHATASRTSVFLSTLSFRLALAIASPLQIGPLPFPPIAHSLARSFTLSPSLYFSLALWSRVQSSISNDYARRSPQVDPTATHERSRSVQSRGSVHEGVRTALSLLLPASSSSYPLPVPLYADLFTSSTFSESKVRRVIRRRAYILHRRANANFQYICMHTSGPLFAFERFQPTSLARITAVIAPNRSLKNLTYIDLPPSLWAELKQRSLLHLGQENRQRRKMEKRSDQIFHHNLAFIRE